MAIPFLVATTAAEKEFVKSIRGGNQAGLPSAGCFKGGAD
jgi:hypothetical protein